MIDGGNEMRCSVCEKGKEWSDRLDACARSLAEKMNVSVKEAKIILLDRMEEGS